jgi:catalase
MEDLAVRAVDAINDLAGAHPGQRAAHAKGRLRVGTFTATPEAASLTRAAHMRGDPMRATVRFSNGNGDPNVPDYAREGRGMSVKLYLDGATTDMVALSLPCFFVRTPADFIDFTRARKDPENAGEWFAAHPEIQPAVQAAMAAKPPASYATCAYNSIHSYRYVNSEGDGRYVRFRWEPEAGEHFLEPGEAKGRGPDYLQEELDEREGAGFGLVVTLADEADAVEDPTIAWPEQRARVRVGRLELGGPETEREQGDDVLVFDPTRVSDGIELSDDPILRFRPHAYAVSVERRSGVPSPF